MKCLTTFLLFFLSLPCVLHASTFELIDHSRGFKIETPSPEWSFSPAGNYGITIIKRSSSIRIQQNIYAKPTVAETLEQKKLAIQNNEKESLLAEESPLTLGNLQTTQGLSVQRKGYNIKNIEYFWFPHRNNQYEIEIEYDPAKESNFPKEARELLGKMQLF